MANILASLAPELCGILRVRHVRCGKKNCRCQQGYFHGPYLYLQYRRFHPNKGWVKATRYIHPDDADRVREELQAARQYTKAAVRERQKDLEDGLKRLQACFREEFGRHV